jgi:hypothetical protein
MSLNENALACSILFSHIILLNKNKENKDPYRRHVLDQPPVGGVHVVGWCADPSGLLALDYQHPSVVGIGGNSEK